MRAFEADVIYDVLVEEVGAREDDRETFVHMQTRDEGCREYRFMGSLGFGGKFWDSGDWWVGCYRENETPERLAAIERANARLSALRAAS